MRLLLPTYNGRQPGCEPTKRSSSPRGRAIKVPHRSELRLIAAAGASQLPTDMQIWIHKHGSLLPRPRLSTSSQPPTYKDLLDHVLGMAATHGCLIAAKLLLASGALVNEPVSPYTETHAGSPLSPIQSKANTSIWWSCYCLRHSSTADQPLMSI
jgi:hypothetical protein